MLNLPFRKKYPALSRTLVTHTGTHKHAPPVKTSGCYLPAVKHHLYKQYLADMRSHTHARTKCLHKQDKKDPVCANLYHSWRWFKVQRSRHLISQKLMLQRTESCTVKQSVLRPNVETNSEINMTKRKHQCGVLCLLYCPYEAKNIPIALSFCKLV